MTVTGPLEAREVNGPAKGSNDGDLDRKAYLIQDLPEDLAEMLRTQKTPEDLPGYPYEEPSNPLSA